MEARSRSPRWSLGVRAACALLLLTLLAGCSGDDTTPEKASVSPTTSPSSTERGSVVDPAVLRRDVDDVFAGSTGIYDPVRAVLVVQHGRPVVRRYYGPGTRTASNIMSVTKSVIGTLVGIAVDEGLLRLDDTLAELLPAYADHMRPNVAAITVEQLLTMTSGLTPDVHVGVLPFERSRDWVADILDRGITATPGEFAYSSAGSHLLAAILTEATGKPGPRLRPGQAVRPARHRHPPRRDPGARPGRQPGVRRGAVRLGDRSTGGEPRLRLAEAPRN